MRSLLFPDLTLSSFLLPVAGRRRMAFTASLGFAPDGRVLPPGEAWGAALNALAPGEIPDMGVPKPAAEWLMAGAACADSNCTGLPVDVEIGPLRRRFLVSGDCEDDGISVPAPRPFRRMPLGWTRTYGGPEHPDNPLGCGILRENGTLRMPNVADRDAPGPACPGARGFWPSRMHGLGTYDTPWLLTRWPGVPDDFDWAFYHLAQPEQRFSGYLTGCETFRVTNMHPERPVIEGTLPRLRLRLFADYGGDEAPDWREAIANADTVWLFPNDLTGLLFWHATLPTEDERGSDINRIVAALEAADQEPRPAQELILAALAMEQETAPEAEPQPAEDSGEEAEAAAQLAATAALPKIATVPQVSGQPDPAKLPDNPAEPEEPDDPGAQIADMARGAKEEISRLLPEINALLASQGLPKIEAEDVSRMLDDQAKSMTDMLATPMPDSAQALEQAGFPPDYLDSAMELAKLEAPSPETFPAPEAFREAVEKYVDTFGKTLDAPESVRQQMRQLLLMQAESPETALDSLFPENTLAGLEEKTGLSLYNLKELEAIPLEAGDAGSLAFLEQAAPLLGLEKEKAAQMLVALLCHTRTEFYSPDMLGTELSEVARDFPDQAGAFAALEQSLANLPQEELFDLSTLGLAAGVHGPALAALARLDPLPMTPQQEETPETDAELEALPQEEEDNPPSLGDAPEPETPDVPTPEDKESFLSALACGLALDGLDLSDIDLSGLDLSGLDLSGIVLTGSAGLRGLLLEQSRCDSADFSGCDLTGTRFSGASFTGARFAGANLSGCSFTGADLSGADLSGAFCDGADFTGARLRGANLSGMHCDDADFSGTDLTESRWEGAAGTGARFGASRGADADFSRSRLLSCDFDGAALSGARFSEAVLLSTTFENCALTGADFTGADLSNARIYDTRLTDCRFTDATLADGGWKNVDAERLDARNVVATGAVFEECAFREADWACASARRAQWLGCDLHGARLDRIDLLDGGLRGSRLGGASLAGASLFNADLYLMGVNEKTDLSGADLANTCLTLAERA